MRNRRKEQELKEQIVALRNKQRAVDAELKQKMIEYYICTGSTPDQAVKMVQ